MGGGEKEKERESKRLYYKIQYETIGITLMFIQFLCLPAAPHYASLISGQIILLISGKMHVYPMYA